jgi:hypothetical protein
MWVSHDSSWLLVMIAKQGSGINTGEGGILGSPLPKLPSIILIRNIVECHRITFYLCVCGLRGRNVTFNFFLGAPDPRPSLGMLPHKRISLLYKKVVYD